MTSVTSRLSELEKATRIERAAKLQRGVQSELLAWRRRQHLIFAGYSDAEIIQLGDLAKLTNERMNELLQANNLETIEILGEGLKNGKSGLTDVKHRMPLMAHLMSSSVGLGFLSSRFFLDGKLIAKGKIYPEQIIDR